MGDVRIYQREPLEHNWIRVVDTALQQIDSITPGGLHQFRRVTKRKIVKHVPRSLPVFTPNGRQSQDNEAQARRVLSLGANPLPGEDGILSSEFALLQRTSSPETYLPCTGNCPRDGEPKHAHVVGNTRRHQSNTP